MRYTLETKPAFELVRGDVLLLGVYPLGMGRVDATRIDQSPHGDSVFVYFGGADAHSRSGHMLCRPNDLLLLLVPS